jgi:transcriptional regulator with XRE-family HTH domain
MPKLLASPPPFPARLYIPEHIRAGKARGVSYHDMAQAMAVDPATITKWRKGRNIASLSRLTVRDDRVTRLAKVLGIRPIDLLFPPGARPDVNALLVNSSDEFVRSVAAVALHMRLHR